MVKIYATRIRFNNRYLQSEVHPPSKACRTRPETRIMKHLPLEIDVVLQVIRFGGHLSSYTRREANDTASPIPARLMLLRHSSTMLYHAIPLPTRSSTSATKMRVPRKGGCPWQIFGSLTTYRPINFFSIVNASRQRNTLQLSSRQSSQFSNRRPGTCTKSVAETWSVSRTSKLSFVGLLLAVLASEPFGVSG
jgi:hypothetical protein